MAKHLLLNDITTTIAKYKTAEVLDDTQHDVSEIEIAGGIFIPYLSSQDELIERYLTLKAVETRTPAVVLFQSLQVAGLIP